MTGTEVKELLTQALRAKYWLLQRPEDVEQAFAEALAALEPCKVLTAEENSRRHRAIGLAQALSEAHDYDGMDNALVGVRKVAAEIVALLAPEKVTL